MENTSTVFLNLLPNDETTSMLTQEKILTLLNSDLTLIIKDDYPTGDIDTNVPEKAKNYIILVTFPTEIVENIKKLQKLTTWNHEAKFMVVVTERFADQFEMEVVVSGTFKLFFDYSILNVYVLIQNLEVDNLLQTFIWHPYDDNSCSNILSFKYGGEPYVSHKFPNHHRRKPLFPSSHFSEENSVFTQTFFFHFTPSSARLPCFHHFADQTKTSNLETLDECEMFSNGTSNSTAKASAFGDDDDDDDADDEAESEDSKSADVEGGGGGSDGGLATDGNNTTIDNNIKSVDINASSEHKFVWREMKAELPRLPDRFHQCPLTITTPIWEPFVYGTREMATGGIEVLLIEVIAEKLDMNATFRVIDDATAFSTITEDEETGFYSDLIKRKVDIMIGGLYDNKVSRKLLSTTIPYDSDEMTWCVQKSGLRPNWMNVFAIFDIMLW